MLEYFYSGEIDKSKFKNIHFLIKKNILKETIEKHSENLFAIAHKYQVKQLMQVCEYYMAEHIDVANFNERCNYAELYCLSNLEKVGLG
ncbi:unnamed protein product [Meloidogyne enterolobii]|uniref:Uncharacterized protein n=1 Tax=Meloidogyne enterolobii TaxID=390850 RepID=A0ACB1AJW3_MELEN